MRRLNRSACVACVLVTASCSPAADENVAFYRLRSPGNVHDIEQASGLHYGRLSDREGLWTVCDRNGRRSAGRLFFISKTTLSRAVHRQTIIADDAFTIVFAEKDWSIVVARDRSVGADVLAKLKQRIESVGSSNGKLPLDLEAITIAPSLQAPHEPRVFVVAEEPFSLILELSLEGGGKRRTSPAASRLSIPGSRR